MTDTARSPEVRISSTLALWNKLPSGVVGSALFSIGMCARVPFFATVLPRVVTLQPGLCVVKAPKWFGVRNHLGTFHAIASCNLAEAAMGMLAEATVPTTHRWIPKGMQVSYLGPAKTGLKATATMPSSSGFTEPDFTTLTEGRDIVVAVAITDNKGVEVVHADITIWVTPR